VVFAGWCAACIPCYDHPVGVAQELALCRHAMPRCVVVVAWRCGAMPGPSCARRASALALRACASPADAWRRHGCAQHDVGPLHCTARARSLRAPRRPQCPAHSAAAAAARPVRMALPAHRQRLVRLERVTRLCSTWLCPRLSSLVFLVRHAVRRPTTARASEVLCSVSAARAAAGHRAAMCCAAATWHASCACAGCARSARHASGRLHACVTPLLWTLCLRKRVDVLLCAAA
jgi:hypothetical protein